MCNQNHMAAQGQAGSPLDAGVNPVLCSAHDEPVRHYKLDEYNRPTGVIENGRRRSANVIPLPPSEQGGNEALGDQQMIPEVNRSEQDAKALNRVNRLRDLVGDWRALPISERKVTPATAILLEHWESGRTRQRLFFCQKEAIQTLIWLSEIAPKTKVGREILSALRVNAEGMNLGVFRLAAKIATGGGKTTVMAMLIAWQAANFARKPGAGKFVNRFLVLCPGITVRERLRVLIPSERDSLYRGLVPDSLIKDVMKARVSVQNFHKLRPAQNQSFLTVGDDGKLPSRAKSILQPIAAMSPAKRREAVMKCTAELFDGKGSVTPAINKAAKESQRDEESLRDAVLRVCGAMLDAGKSMPPKVAGKVKRFLLAETRRVALLNACDGILQAGRGVSPDLLGRVRAVLVDGALDSDKAAGERVWSSLKSSRHPASESANGEILHILNDGVESGRDAALRVCKGLLDERVPLNRQQIMVINDEAHHCYVSKSEAGAWRLANEVSGDGMDGDDVADDDGQPEDRGEREELESMNEAARVWMSGIKNLKEAGCLYQVTDLSATPQFLRGQGYGEGRFFPWVVSDFGLIEAIESGIVKMPRFPVNDEGAPALVTDNVYNEIKGEVKGLRNDFSGKNEMFPPDRIPAQLAGAIARLYEHYKRTSDKWGGSNLQFPPVMIVVCSDTKMSRLVYDHIAGYVTDASESCVSGKCPLLANVLGGKIHAEPRTLLIDSRELESGESLSPQFKKTAERQVAAYAGKSRGKMSVGDLMREAMNTVGQPGKLGQRIRCIVSVGMLTEGWDARNVTHILGARAFSTQLLCEQVVGRALRRVSYEPSEETGLNDAEFAEVAGVPFAFASTSERDPKPAEVSVYTDVVALPERANLQIDVPVVVGYRHLPREKRVVADFSETEAMHVDATVSPNKTVMKSFVGGDAENITFDDLRERTTVTFVAHKLAAGVARKGFQGPNGTKEQTVDAEGVPAVPPARIADLAGIARNWLKNHVTYADGADHSYFALPTKLNAGIETILSACRVEESSPESARAAQFSEFLPKGRSSATVKFQTRKGPDLRHETVKSHVNWAVCDSEWEMGWCAWWEKCGKVISYIRNDHLGLEIPYVYEGRAHMYLPDFVLHVDDGRGEHDPLKLVVEVKGFRDDRDRAKAHAAKNEWVPSLSGSASLWGRWGFTEVTKPPFNPKADRGGGWLFDWTQDPDEFIQGLVAASRSDGSGQYE